jgi:hypothetical protein
MHAYKYYALVFNAVQERANYLQVQRSFEYDIIQFWYTPEIIT